MMELGSTRYYIGTFRGGGRKNRKYIPKLWRLVIHHAQKLNSIPNSRKLINRKIEVTRRPVNGQWFRINKIKKFK